MPTPSPSDRLVRLVFILRTGARGSVDVPASVAQAAMTLHQNYLLTRSREREVLVVTLGSENEARTILSADVSEISTLHLETVPDVERPEDS